MAYYWLIVTLSWIGSARLEYISTSFQDQQVLPANKMNSIDSDFNSQMPLVLDNLNMPLSNNLNRYQKESAILDILFPRMMLSPSVRVRRTPEEVEGTEVDSWLPHFAAADTDVRAFLPLDEHISPIPLIIQRYEGYASTAANNASDIDDIGKKTKRSFSPWGGKRDAERLENDKWTWKRAAAMREPSMPKRVRFSPWGGKRSSQLIFKPGHKASKIFFSNSDPNLARISSKYLPISGGEFNIAGFQLIPGMDKRHPIRILALSSKLEDRNDQNDIPFRTFIESAKFYKPGHPYSSVSLKKDGKRKVKFSAWGGKRSPPIIGPIWSPSTQTIKDYMLNTILFIRNNQGINEKITKAL